MTAKRLNPAKRGRKPISNDVRRAVALRWICFLRDKQRADDNIAGADVADDFILANQPWFRAHDISPGDYRTLRNILVEGRKHRKQQLLSGWISRDWGIIENVAGRKSLVSNAAYMRAAQRAALGLGQPIDLTNALIGPELK